MMMTESIQTTSNDQAVSLLKKQYPSVYQRTQYCKFWFKNEYDANRFTRDFKPSTKPNKDCIEGTWVVQL